MGSQYLARARADRLKQRDGDLLDHPDAAEALCALRRFAFSLTRNEDRAADLVQDCLERCLRKQYLFDGRNLRSWMFTVCRRVFLNQIRREQSRGIALELDDAPLLALSVEGNQDSFMAFRDLCTSMENLSLDDRTMLSMIAVDGLRYEDVAEALDVPVGTVRSRLSRARTKLKDSLDAVV